jgi:ribosomal protein L11 methyltransferase
MGIDIDPVAISTAKANAALNEIPHVQFRVADVVSWRMPQQIDVVTANLFSELLVQIIPKLKAAGWLIISGVMREQERGVINALKRSGFKIQTMRRRGKWIVALCAFRGARF